ncbi:TIGR00282 family metallophosphoesterase [Mycoplasmopsis felis]|uniref:TIGR00282 family metallophosphoesterase n=1 Tax=Mycoplasmopsis felis TaxID=33923 RepID=UPI002AFF23B4|nr:TIGR00282 family metallophosphoesterase [Mycoplasmopsis felis]WQQ03202.1 TIGR00282 family metallophosphoesterase [Mycoplasmopsis felis]
MELKILFIGDIFGLPGIVTIEKHLQRIVKKHNIDFVIAQGENITGRKGLNELDYIRLTKAGINCFTMGNHVWANEDIYNFIHNSNVIRPLNIMSIYPGVGSKIFEIKNFRLRVSSLLGQTFNELLEPWKQTTAGSFIDAFDEINKNKNHDFHLIDFHAETTSEKYAFALYVDGQVDAFCGTHTHVQTNDAHILPNGTAYITDVGMTGPIDSAIGVETSVIINRLINPNKKTKFYISNNNTQLNAVVITLTKNGLENKRHKIEKINLTNLEIYK